MYSTVLHLYNAHKSWFVACNIAMFVAQAAHVCFFCTVWKICIFRQASIMYNYNFHQLTWNLCECINVFILFMVVLFVSYDYWFKFYYYTWWICSNYILINFFSLLNCAHILNPNEHDIVWHWYEIMYVKCQTSYQFIKLLILIRIDFQFISYVPYPINISFIVKRVQNRIIFGLLLFGMIKSIEMTNNHSKGNNKMNTKQK